MRLAHRRGWKSFASTLITLALVSVAAGEAEAAADEPIQKPDGRRVRVFFAGADADEMRALVDEKLIPLGLKIEFCVDPEGASPPRSIDPETLAYVFLDFRDAQRASLLVVDGSLERGLARYAARGNGDELAREDLAHVLEEALPALMAGYKIGVERPVEAPRPAPPPPPQPPPPPAASWHLGAALGYELGAYGPSAPLVHGLRVALEATHRTPDSPWFPGFRFDTTLRPSTDLDTDPIQLRLTIVSLRALATLDTRLASALTFSGFAGAGTDVVRTAPRSTSPGIVPGPAGTRATATLRLGIGVSIRGPASLSLRLFSDVDLVRPDYVYFSGSQEKSISTSYVARPGIAIDLGTP